MQWCPLKCEHFRKNLCGRRGVYFHHSIHTHFSSPADCNYNYWSAHTTLVGVQRNQQAQHWLNMNIYSSPAAPTTHANSQSENLCSKQNIYSVHTRVVFHTHWVAGSTACVCCGVCIPAHVLTFVFAGCRCRWINIDYAANIMRVVPYRCLWVVGIILSW